LETAGAFAPVDPGIGGSGPVDPGIEGIGGVRAGLALLSKVWKGFGVLSARRTAPEAVARCWLDTGAVIRHALNAAAMATATLAIRRFPGPRTR